MTPIMQVNLDAFYFNWVLLTSEHPTAFLVTNCLTKELAQAFVNEFNIRNQADSNKNKMVVYGEDSFFQLSYPWEETTAPYCLVSNPDHLKWLRDSIPVYHAIIQSENIEMPKMEFPNYFGVLADWRVTPTDKLNSRFLEYVKGLNATLYFSGSSIVWNYGLKNVRNLLIGNSVLTGYDYSYNDWSPVLQQVFTLEVSVLECKPANDQFLVTINVGDRLFSGYKNTVMRKGDDYAVILMPQPYVVGSTIRLRPDYHTLLRYFSANAPYTMARHEGLVWW